ncbi:MAG: peptidylprolyl isomerase [Clostridia bacterium]|nr:peptidylprolyl isomerase [Clostridia bacterium]
MNNKKITCLLTLILSAIMMMSMLVSCNNEVVNNGEQSDNNQVATDDMFDFSELDISTVSYFKPEGEQTGYIENNGEKIVPEYVLKINGIPVSIEEYRYPYLNEKFRLDGGDDTLWTEEAAEENRLTAEDAETVKNNTVNYLKQTMIFQFLAAKYNVSLSEEEIKQVDDLMQSTRDSFNAEDSDYTYEEALNESYLTDAYLRYGNLNASLSNKVFSAFYIDENAPLKFSAEQAVQYLKDSDYIRAQHILIKFPDEPTEGTEEEIAAAVAQNKADTLKKAEEVLEKVNAGEDFMTLVEQYNEDPGMGIYGEDGYYFTKGVMVEEFENAAYALEEGATSGLVETSFGYHIIKRLPLEADYILENAATYLVPAYSSDFTDKINSGVESLTIEYAPEYELITPSTLF